jgi:hypothetical protein
LADGSPSADADDASGPRLKLEKVIKRNNLTEKTARKIVAIFLTFKPETEICHNRMNFGRWVTFS